MQCGRANAKGGASLCALAGACWSGGGCHPTSGKPINANEAWRGLPLSGRFWSERRERQQPRGGSPAKPRPLALNGLVASGGGCPRHPASQQLKREGLPPPLHGSPAALPRRGSPPSPPPPCAFLQLQFWLWLAAVSPPALSVFPLCPPAGSAGSAEISPQTLPR